MTSVLVKRLRKILDRGVYAPGGWSSLSFSAPAALRWTIVAGSGVMLGLVALTISELPRRQALLLAIVALCPFAAMVVGDLRRALLAVVLLDIPLQLDVNLMYQPAPASLGAVGGVSVALSTLALGLLYLLWLSGALTRTWQRGTIVGEILPLAAYVGLIALSIQRAYDPLLALFGAAIWVQLLLIYIYIVSTVRTREDLLFVIGCLLVGLIIESLLILGIRVVGSGVAALITDRTLAASGPGYGDRARGTLGSPNNAASYLSLMCLLGAGVLISNLRALYKWLAAIGFAFGLVALILTLSRGGWLSFGIGISILWGLSVRRGWAPLWPLPACGLMVLPVVLLFQDAILSRLASGENGRTPLLRMALAIIQDHPLLGVGANNYAAVIRYYATPEYTGEWLYVVHNTYLLLWSELGLVALVLLIAIFLNSIRLGWRCWHSYDRQVAPIALSLTAALISFLVHMQFDIFNGRMSWQLTLPMLGLVIVIHRLLQANGERLTPS